MTDGHVNGCGYSFARDMWATERLWLSRSVRTILVGLAGQLSGLGPQAWTRYEDGELEFAEAREFQLALLRVHSVLANEIDAGMLEAAAAALDHTAGLGDIASVTGLDRAHAYQRWGALTAVGERIALIISQPWPDGGPSALRSPEALYERDRRWWRVSSAARRNAHYAIVVVDRLVARVYGLDSDGWQPDSTGTRWEFRALGSEPLSQMHVDRAYRRGHLPALLGDPYPARLDRACVPSYFSGGHDGD
ncbi:hypothetical protein ACLMAL_38295 [Nocardia sp. CWNU-33]|uniref:hypothetical protein n=1 Tax=Nocardia sp. CWNU-33 TaxID=3392117 RepID=UPI00398E7DEA